MAISFILYHSCLTCWNLVVPVLQIADWKFPYKRSHHPVCLHESTIEGTAILQNCDPDVAPGTEVHVYTEAAVCSCSLCKSSEASCEGLRYRGVRRAPRDTSKLINDRHETFDGGRGALGNNPSRLDENVLVDGFDGLTESGALMGDVASGKLPAFKTVKYPRLSINKENNQHFGMTPRFIYSSHAKRAAEIYQYDMPLPKDKMTEDYNPHYDIEAFNKPNENSRIGAHGFGIISSSVETSDEPEGKKNKLNENYAVDTFRQLKEENFVTKLLKEFQTMWKDKSPSYNKAQPQSNSFKFTPINPDNMMKPVLDVKKKRSTEYI